MVLLNPLQVGFMLCRRDSPEALMANGIDCAAKIVPVRKPVFHGPLRSRRFWGSPRLAVSRQVKCDSRARLQMIFQSDGALSCVQQAARQTNGRDPLLR